MPQAASGPIQIRALQIQRQGLPLCQPVSLTVQAGETWQISGRNGLGKTTLLLTLAGVLPVTATQADWAGVPPGQWPLHYIGHQTGVSLSLSVWQNLQFLAGRRHSPEALLAALAAVDLQGYEQELVRHLSSGQQRRVALAQLWLPQRPALWLLDEPLVALDTAMVRRLELRMQQYAQAGGRIILTSHQPLSFAHRELHLQPFSEEYQSVSDDFAGNLSS